MGERLSKSDLVGRVASRHSITKRTAEALVDEVFAAITEAVEGGDVMAIRGFGTFEMRDYAARMGRNPQTGEPVPVPPRSAMVFRAAKKGAA